jgi:hypothetical protein
MTGRHRWLLWCGAVAAGQMVVVSVVDGATRDGYDPVRNWVSQLALGPRGWAGALNLAVCGVWLILFAAGLHRHLPGAGAAARLVALCGLGFAVIAAVPIDPGLDFPPGVPAVHTPLGLVHQAGAIALFAGGTLASAMLGRRIGWVRVGAAVAVLMIVSFVGAAVLVTLDVNGVLRGTPSGLLERVALYAGLGWIGTAGLIVYRGAKFTACCGSSPASSGRSSW